VSLLHPVRLAEFSVNFFYSACTKAKGGGYTLTGPYDGRGLMGPKRKTSFGLLVFNPLWLNRMTLNIGKKWRHFLCIPFIGLACLIVAHLNRRGYGCLLALPLPPRCFLFCATDGRWPKPLAMARASMYSCMFTPGYSWGISVQKTMMN
jgi:hypothetical protein